MFNNYKNYSTYPKVTMYNITFSISIEVCGQLTNEFCYFHSLEISINCCYGCIL